MSESAQQGSQNGKDQGESGAGGTSPWEWVAAGVSTALVLGTVTFLGYEAVTERPSPPLIDIVVDTVVHAGSGYVVEFSARNRGQTTAAGLTVEGQLRSVTGSVETSEVTIDYVPAEATRAGGLFFSHDPGRYSLELRPKGYDRP